MTSTNLVVNCEAEIALQSWDGDLGLYGASLVAQMVKNLKNLPAMWETLVRSLGLEDTLEKGMVTHSSILA